MSVNNKKIPRNLLDLSIEEKRKFIESFDYILTDCDGCIWQLSGLINGIGKVITLLQNAGKHITYVTNHSSKSNELYLETFKKIGVDKISVNDIIHPGTIYIDYLKKINFQGLIYPLASTNVIKMLKDAGYSVVEVSNDPFEEKFTIFINSSIDKQEVNAVIIDIDYNCNYSKLIRADFYLQNPNCLFLSGATEIVVDINEKTQILGVGVFPKLIEQSCGRKSIVCGKPGNGFQEYLLEKFKSIEKKRILFVGDMLEQDIQLGNSCGFQTLLLLSGGTNYKELEKNIITGQIIPDYYLNSYNDFIQIFNEIRILNSE